MDPRKPSCGVEPHTMPYIDGTTLNYKKDIQCDTQCAQTFLALCPLTFGALVVHRVSCCGTALPKPYRASWGRNSTTFSLHSAESDTVDNIPDSLSDVCRYNARCVADDERTLGTKFVHKITALLFSWVTQLLQKSGKCKQPRKKDAITHTPCAVLSKSLTRDDYTVQV